MVLFFFYFLKILLKTPKTPLIKVALVTTFKTDFVTTSVVLGPAFEDLVGVCSSCSAAA